MNFFKSIISNKKVVRYRKNNGKIDYIDVDTINKMIKDITMGELGEKLEKSPNGFDLHYVYEGKQIQLEYLRGKYNLLESLYLVYSNGNEVYPRIQQKTLLNTIIDVYNGDPIPKDMLNCENDWINQLFDIYNLHLKLDSEAKMKEDAIKQAEEKKQIVMRIFGFSYPNGYADENVTVSDIKLGEAFTAFPDNEIYYNYVGKITLSDGTVVCDSKNDIYIPGPWEDYICLVVKRMQEEVIAEQMKKHKEAMLKRERLRNNNNN